LRCWQAWRADPQRPKLLHYVAIAQQIPDLNALSAQETPLAQELNAQFHDLEPGFQRFSLAQGQVLLTLCVGERRDMLREQQFVADSVYLDALINPSVWDAWELKALVRCCRRGTVLNCIAPTAQLVQGLSQTGFVMSGNLGHYQPDWDLKTTRETQRFKAASIGTCAVIGAGLAGASVAAALAQRGWQVQVFDTASAPAAGASGLPAGLLAPHVSADDSPRSRLSRKGVRLTLQEAHALLQEGPDWSHSGVSEQREDGSALWHSQAGWIKPARLVQAWLAQPGVHFHGNSQVASLHKQDDEWHLLDASGTTLAKAQHVVLANASGVPDLMATIKGTQALLTHRLNHLPALNKVRGQVSWGLHVSDEATRLPTTPVNGMGSLIPKVPSEQGLAWYLGATYEVEQLIPMSESAQHALNFAKLDQLMPEAAKALRPVFESAQVQAWRGERCVSTDRLPLCGPLEDGDTPSLWISAAMGSRGLSFAALCASLLVAQIGAEPWPIEASLARFLQASRRLT
jgi:tRNA 5-methylaminomethyl-2-thiouridine biosynthesis bifunctional protein